MINLEYGETTLIDEEHGRKVGIMATKEKLKVIWEKIYGSDDTANELINTYIDKLEALKSSEFTQPKVGEKDWYKDAVIYSAYVDLFNKDFQGLMDKLDYLQDLGVNCLWLLPILDSPMKDAGFDISDYTAIRSDLLGNAGEEQDTVFKSFIEEAHKRGIRLIFDIAMNHCSEEHPWFVEGRKSKSSDYRDYFIWADDDKGYKEARIIFKGLCESNWEMDPISGQYFYHRFFEIQPDLNYKNPKVLLEMTQVLVGWKVKGVDGFRADAVPYIWKEEGTICENLPKTHLVVKFFRAVLDYLSPGSLLLAEACQPPSEVVEYFGDGDECNAAYHFPVMPRIYHAMASEDKKAIEGALAPSFTPAIPKESQWFMFLRCHDELTLEMVSPEERAFIYDSYVKDPSWDFRQGEGISARLGELLEFNPKRIRLANSIMLTLAGTPIVYYGDEFAKGNDVAFFDKIYEETGYADSRYLGRGNIDWSEVKATLADPTTVGARVYESLKGMIKLMNASKVFGRGSLEFVEFKDNQNNVLANILAYIREYEGEKVLVIQNLASEAQKFDVGDRSIAGVDRLGQELIVVDGIGSIEGYGVYWI